MVALFLLALALSMDAFAAALCRGAAGRPGLAGAIGVGAAFGLAQAIMPLLGWALGVAFASVIREVDHWVAFVLLGGLGLRMAWNSVQPREDEAEQPAVGAGLALFATALATSVDAAAAGVTLNLLQQPVLLSCAVIGAVTLALSTGGVLIGGVIGAAAGRRAELFGGLLLVGLGVKILAEHLGWLA